MVLGDPLYGHGVEDDETFSAQLDDRLGDTVQVLNLGTPGYSSAQSINLKTMRGWRLAADLGHANLWSDNTDSFVDRRSSQSAVMPRILAFPLPPACSSRAHYIGGSTGISDWPTEPTRSRQWAGCSVEPRLVATAA